MSKFIAATLLSVLLSGPCLATSFEQQAEQVKQETGQAAQNVEKKLEASKSNRTATKIECSPRYSVVNPNESDEIYNGYVFQLLPVAVEDQVKRENMSFDTIEQNLAFAKKRISMAIPIPSLNEIDSGFTFVPYNKVVNKKGELVGSIYDPFFSFDLGFFRLQASSEHAQPLPRVITLRGQENKIHPLVDFIFYPLRSSFKTDLEGLSVTIAQVRKSKEQIPVEERSKHIGPDIYATYVDEIVPLRVAGQFGFSVDISSFVDDVKTISVSCWYK